MKQRSGWRHIVAAAVAVMTLCAGGGIAATSAAADEIPTADINVQKIDGLPADFVEGADVGITLSMYEGGLTYKDENGNPVDLDGYFQLLHDSGLNYIRTRVWNNPYDADGNGYGAGNVSPERAVEIGKLATKHGMKMLVDFHYSDFWADPGKSVTPKMWAGITDQAQLADALHDFTKETLQKFKDAGVDVGMVQVGNETNSCIAGRAAMNCGFKNMAVFMNAGSKAVREVYPDALVALHFANPNKGQYKSWADQLNQYGVDYDVFASSYYRFWHGTLDNLKNQFNYIIDKYDKKVMVAETAWAFTTDNGDAMPNSITSSNLDPSWPYAISPQGQAGALRDIAETVNAVDKNKDGSNAGLGFFYWEPGWLPVNPADRTNSDANKANWTKYGTGWKTEAGEKYQPENKQWGGSEWDNMALFDFDGTALPSLKVFKYLHTGAAAPHEPTDAAPITVSVKEGDDIAAAIPAKATINYRDGKTEEQNVTWNTDTISLIAKAGAGTYTLTGTASPSGVTVTATIKVAPKNAVTNYAKNGDFSSGKDNWTFTGTETNAADPHGYWVGTSKNGAASDGQAFNFFDDKAFNISAKQTITGLKPGKYTLSADSYGGDFGNNTTLNLTANANGKDYEAKLGLNGWRVKYTGTIDNIIVGDDGTATIGVTLGSLDGGEWGSIDNFSLTYVGVTVDTSELAKAVSEATKVDRTQYTADSLAKLDQVVEQANVVIAGSAFTQDEVKTQIDVVKAAIAALQKKDNGSGGNGGSTPAPSPEPEPEPEPGESVDVWRVYNPNSGLHHYTTSKFEYDQLVAQGWNGERSSFKAAQRDDANPNIVPVYRLYNPNDGNHHWTMSVFERDSLVSLGWHDEGVGWYVDKSGSVDVYRLYNPNSGEHVYTTNKAEYDRLGSLGWHQENVAWKGL